MLIFFAKNNIVLVSVSLFLLFFCIIVYLKPGFLFNKNGSIRNFGLGYKKKTVLPIWLVSIILSILAYYIVLYFISLPKLANI